MPTAAALLYDTVFYMWFGKAGKMGLLGIYYILKCLENDWEELIEVFDCLFSAGMSEGCSEGRLWVMLVDDLTTP